MAPQPLQQAAPELEHGGANGQLDRLQPFAEGSLSWLAASWLSRSTSEANSAWSSAKSPFFWTPPQAGSLPVPRLAELHRSALDLHNLVKVLSATDLVKRLMGPCPGWSGSAQAQ